MINTCVNSYGGDIFMRFFTFAVCALLSTPAYAEQLTGVLVNPYSGFVRAIIVVDGAKVQPHNLSGCGAGCEFTDFMMPGQCMVVSISTRDAAYGYYIGPEDDLANSRAQAHRYCQRYGGTACKEYRPICD